jgi:ankyrin repeat protein
MQTDLVDACNRDDQATVATLLHEGAEPNGVDEKGYSALHHCSSRGHVGITESLLRQGAAVDQFDALGQAALHHCCIKNHAGIAALLIANKANINATTTRGSTVRTRTRTHAIRRFICAFTDLFADLVALPIDLLFMHGRRRKVLTVY